MKADLFQLWVYLSATPLFGLAATLVAYSAGLAIARHYGHRAIANPVALAVLMLIPVLLLFEVPYARYFEGAQFVHFLLGPATVALAVPLVAQWPRLTRLRWRLALALSCGAVATAGSALLLAWLMGASGSTLRSLMPKSVTAPIAMGISEQIGGTPSLTAIYCILTGIVGAMAGPALIRRLGIQNQATLGFSLGLAAHGIGTARAFQSSAEAGAFAGLAMALHGVIAALVMPLLAGRL